MLLLSGLSIDLIVFNSSGESSFLKDSLTADVLPF